MASVHKGDAEIDRSARRALVVVGMHRSGTSAITRTLSLLGASLPKGLMPALANNNESGFWEPLSVAQLNDEILQALDSDWDDVFAFKPRQYLSNFDRFSLGRAVEILEQEFDGSQLIVLKDPRISVLSSFWDRALREAGFEPHYIVMVRNPLEVAESLRTRDGFPREKSLLLWSSYMIAAERDTRERKRTFVAFDHLMSDWRAVRSRIEQDTGVPFPRDTAAAAIEVDRFLNRNLRHHSPGDDLYSRADVPDEVKTLYRVFSAACEGADVDAAALKAVEAELEKVDRLIGPLVADLRGSTRRLASEVAELSSARSSLAQQLETEKETAALRDAQSLELAERLTAIEAERDRAIGEAAEIGRRIEELAERVAVSQLERDEVTARLADAQVERDSAAARLADAQLELDQEREARALVSARADGLSEEVLQLSKARKQDEGRIQDGHKKIAVIVDKWRETEAELAARKEKIDSVSAELTIAQEELSRGRREVSSLNRAVRESDRVAKNKESQVEWLKRVSQVLDRSAAGWRRFMPAASRKRHQLNVLRRLGLFNAEAYLERYPDVVDAGLDPLYHYITHGMGEGRQADIKLD